MMVVSRIFLFLSFFSIFFFFLVSSTYVYEDGELKHLSQGLPPPRTDAAVVGHETPPLIEDPAFPMGSTRRLVVTPDYDEWVKATPFSPRDGITIL